MNFITLKSLSRDLGGKKKQVCCQQGWFLTWWGRKTKTTGISFEETKLGREEKI